MPEMDSKPISSPRLGRSAGVAVALVILAIGVFAAQRQFQLSCGERASMELPLCAADLQVQTDAKEGDWRVQLTRSPGDSTSLIRLAHFLARRGDPSLAGLAMRLAPADPNVLALAAKAALDRHDWKNSAELLIRLVRDHDSEAGAQALASMVAQGHAPYLLPSVGRSNPWLAPVLHAMGRQGFPVTRILPLLAAEVRAGGGDPDVLRVAIGQLKAQGAWFDAHALWLSVQGRGLPLLYNGDFARAFEPGGFDWEPSVDPRAGVRVRRAGTGRFAHALRLEYDGRLLPRPQIRQLLVLAPGRYRLEGWYAASRFKADAGPSWDVACAARDAPTLARSTPLQDTAGQWSNLMLEFEVPVACAMGVQLALQADLGASAAGAQGKIEFGEMRIRALEAR